MNFNYVAIVSIKGSDYRIYFWHMSKDNAINIMKNSNLKKGVIINIFSLYIKWVKQLIIKETEKQC